MPSSSRSKQNSINDVVRAMKHGAVVAYPTETTYGLGCDPRDAKAVRRVFTIKGRPDGKPVLLTASSMAQVRKVVDATRLTACARKTFLHLTRRHWPGALTLVLPARRDAKLVRHIAPKGEVAIRVTSSPIAAMLAKRYGFPVVSTSANRSGREPARSAGQVLKAFTGGPLPDLLIDAGRTGKAKPSTLARILPDGGLEVLRQGSIRLKLKP